MQIKHEQGAHGAEDGRRRERRDTNQTRARRAKRLTTGAGGIEMGVSSRHWGSCGILCALAGQAGEGGNGRGRVRDATSAQNKRSCSPLRQASPEIGRAIAG